MQNYRPISILPFLSKVVEKLLEIQIHSYYAKFNILSPFQFGFRRGHSTESALLYFSDWIKTQLDSGMIAGAVFIDYTKAFDNINHCILFSKLESYGITGPALTLIKSYLSDRYQSVCIEGILSSPRLINKGVPQGSILGPLLFLTYINDLQTYLNTTQCLLYADDTTIMATGNTSSELTTNLDSLLHSLENWSHANCIKINPSKTSFVVFHAPQRKITSHLSITINNVSIPQTHSATFLGVIVDSNLKFNHHVASVVNKIRFGIRALIRTRPFFSLDTLLSIYYAFIHSHINYCITSWGSTYRIHLSILISMQKQALRIITFSSFTQPSAPLFHSLHVLPLEHLHKFQVLVFLFKVINKYICVNFVPENIITNNNVTRFALSNNLLLPKVRTNYGKQTTSFFTISTWNNLPPSLKTPMSLYKFKKMLKHHLFESLDV